MGGKPYLFNVHAKIIVNEFIAHPRNILPGDMRVLLAQFVRKPFDGFANDFDLADHPILNQGLFGKSRFIQSAQIRFDFYNRVQDVPEIDRFITLHK